MISAISDWIYSVTAFMGLWLWFIPMVLGLMKTAFKIYNNVHKVTRDKAVGKYSHPYKVGEVVLMVFYSVCPLVNIFYPIGDLWDAFWRFMNAPIVKPYQKET